MFAFKYSLLDRLLRDKELVSFTSEACHDGHSIKY